MAVLELIFNVLGNGLIGYVPERQPWRAIVTGVYLTLSAAGVVLIAWLFVQAL